MSKFDELREKYPTFVYIGYDYRITEDVCQVEYLFEIPGLSEFRPTWEFPVKKAVDTKILDRMIFCLGMVEAISYYKCTCAPKIEIMCGKLSKRQREWWKKLFYNGLGEFMYLNNIEISMEELFEFDCPEGPELPLRDTDTYEGCLIPVGGGKDSVVSMELLRNEKVATYHINSPSAIKEVIDIYDAKEYDYGAKRKLCPNMLELNRQGFLNGHTPFSAIVAFSSIIAALLTGKKYIVLSNENSANETTVKDSFVNHQYSKSYEFEEDFEWYVRTITDSDIHYFSLLRPLAEIQIAALFSKFKSYHKLFRSCNVGSKTGIWCCDCPKCLFVYIILCPFISEEDMKEMFGEKLLDKPSLEEDFKKLTGILLDKPFECVGTRKEVMIALKAYVENGGRSLLTDKYRNVILQERDNLTDMLKGWNDENNVPKEYSDIVRRSMNIE